MDSINPIRPVCTSAPAGIPAPIPPCPAPQEPSDTLDTSQRQTGIDFSKASKLVSYESDNLPEAITLWKFDTEHYDSTAFVSPGGHFYEGGLDGTLRRFAPDGSILWEKKTGHNDLSVVPSVAPDGTAYVSRTVALEAYNPDGTLKWDLPLPDGRDIPRNSLHGQLSLGPEGNAYIFDATQLYAITPNGKVRWKKKMQSAWHDNPPVVGADGTLCCCDRQNTICAFDSMGKQIWKNTDIAAKEAKTLPDVTTQLALGPDGSVYFGTRNSKWNENDCKLMALDGKGHMKWSISTDSELSNYEEPSVDQKTGLVYTGSGRNGRELWAVDPDGTVLWKKDVGSILHVTAMPEGRGVIVGIKGGDLHAFEPDGKPIWTFHTGNIFTKPSFGPDGMVLVGSGKSLYALESRDKFLARKLEEKKDAIMKEPDSAPSPAVEEESGWIIIGGVKLPIHT
jgi:outer membrane protein assembly factor BamB